MLTDEQRLLIRQLRADGVTYERISDMVGCSMTRAYEVSYDVKTRKEIENELESRKLLRRIKRMLRYMQDHIRNGTVKPCEHCKWRMNKEPRPVCVTCYREAFRGWP